MLIHKITSSIDDNKLSKRFATKLSESINKNSIIKVVYKLMNKKKK